MIFEGPWIFDLPKIDEELLAEIEEPIYYADSDSDI
jgi:hypothetical protein